MTHFVYVYVSTSGSSQELKWSIASVRKYFKGSFKIFVFGTNPRISGIEYVFVNQIQNKKNAKAIDSYVKLNAIANHKGINDNFVYMHDDMIFLRPFTFDDLNFPLAFDHIKNLAEYVKTRKAGNNVNYHSIFCATFNLLKKKKLPTWNYENHYPKVFNKEKIIKAIKHFGLLSAKNVKDNIPYLFNSLYFNYFEKAPFDSLELNKNLHQGFYSPFKLDTIEKMCKGKLVLNFNDNGITPDMTKFIYSVIL